jgi:DNA-binding NarL/FixJ family response regulator
MNVIVVATYPSVRAGLRALLGGEPDIVVIAERAGNGWDADTELPRRDAGQPLIFLVDVDPGHAELPARLARYYPDAAQVLLFETPDDYRHPDAGGGGAPVAALLKDAAGGEIVAALRGVTQGLVVLDPAIAAQLVARPGAWAREDATLDEPLTEREMQVLQLLALGLPNKTIAMELKISEHTAKFHVGSIMAKLDAASRTEAVAQAARRGLLVL